MTEEIKPMKIEAGVQVYLNSGGPNMTVIGVEIGSEPLRVKVAHFADDGKYKTFRIPAAALSPTYPPKSEEVQ